MSSDTVPEARKENPVPEEWMTLRENHQYEYSLAVLAAQERDREADREHFRRSQKTGLRFMTGVGIGVIILIVAAFTMDKEQFLLESLKYLAVGGGGGGIGYVFGYRRGKRE